VIDEGFSLFAFASPRPQNEKRKGERKGQTRQQQQQAINILFQKEFMQFNLHMQYAILTK
jgi:hypothetical protein